MWRGQEGDHRTGQGSWEGMRGRNGMCDRKAGGTVWHKEETSQKKRRTVYDMCVQKCHRTLCVLTKQILKMKIKKGRESGVGGEAGFE